MTQGRKLAINSISLLVNRLTQGIATFILTANIARNLGASALGQYLLAIGYYYIFVNLASQGLKTLFTREIARNPEETPIYLVNGTLLQLIVSIIGYIGLVTVIFLLPYSPETSFICYITGLTIVPFALSNITEAIFQAQERMDLIAISTVPVYILRLFVMLWAMHSHYGIEYVAGIFAFSELVILIIEWVLITKIVKPKWVINPNFIWSKIKSVRTLFAIEGVGIIANKMDLVIISLLGSEFLIGIYGAVKQLLEPYFIISSSISAAAFPAMSKAAYLGGEKQQKLTEEIIEILLCMGLPLFVGLLFFAEDLISLIYKDPSFTQASVILNMISLVIITSSFSRVASYLLVANNFERYNLISAVSTTVIGGFVGVALVSQYKLIGAASMALVMSLGHLSIMMYAVYKHLFSLKIEIIMRRPLLISALMMILFIIFKQTRLDFLVTLILAIAGYCFLAGLLAINHLGGLQAVKQKVFKQK